MECMQRAKRNAAPFFMKTTLFLLGMFFLVPGGVYAQVAASTVDRQAALEQELNAINLEISGLNNTITDLKGQKNTLDRDIKLLTANIDKANLNIKAKNLEIARLSSSISEKSQTVKELSTRLENERRSLAQLIRRTNELSQASLTESILSGSSISEFFTDLDSYEALRIALKDSSDALRNARAETQAAQEELEERQRAQIDAKVELERNKQLVQSNQAEKKKLLAITNNKTKEYQSVLADRQKRAAEIRAALFALRDSDSGGIPFGQALDYANVVSARTGIRPAFLLAVFQQESSFGKNVGSCYLRDAKTGAGVGMNTGRVFERVMKPGRDVEPFLQITEALGRDPFKTRVSCPQEIGWGGAMGPAQFIPSTWILFTKRITSALGTSYADPWNPRDAFMAAAFYLTDLGARPNSYSAERDAACRYFSGSRCSQSSWAATYGTQVMQKAEVIQTTMIDPLQNT